MTCASRSTRPAPTATRRVRRGQVAAVGGWHATRRRSARGGRGAARPAPSRTIVHAGVVPACGFWRGGGGGGGAGRRGGGEGRSFLVRLRSRRGGWRTPAAAVRGCRRVRRRLCGPVPTPPRAAG